MHIHLPQYPHTQTYFQSLSPNYCACSHAVRQSLLSTPIKPPSLSANSYTLTHPKQTMGNAERDVELQRAEVQIPPTKPFLQTLKASLKETLFPDDPFKQFNNQPLSRKLVLGFQYFVPILEWAPTYTFQFFKADFIAGITIASLAVPQGISYAGLASLPPVIGLCKFVSV